MSNEEKTDKFEIDFVGVGWPRCASSWIYECLREHPEICTSSKKETHYFSDYYGRGLEWYKGFYNKCSNDQVKGEFTPAYVWKTEEVIPRIKKHNPEIKVIICLRNPIERVYSSYLYLRARGEKQQFLSFREAIERDMIDDVKIYPYLKQWVESFPKDQILILLFKDLKESPKEFIQSIYSFLEVDKEFVPSLINKKVNPVGSVSPKLKVVSKLLSGVEYFLRKHRSSKPTTMFKKSFLYKWLRQLSIRIKDANLQTTSDKREKPSMKEEDKSYLKDKIAEDIAKTEELINKDLSRWK